MIYSRNNCISYNTNRTFSLSNSFSQIIRFCKASLDTRRIVSVRVPFACHQIEKEGVAITKYKKNSVLKMKQLTLAIAFLFFNILAGQNAILNNGSGSFKIEGGENRKGDSITIHYHKPVTFTPNSKILLVIPGAGRNGDDYRDAWIYASEKYNVLIISPSYPENKYDYGGYHLGGVVKDLDLSKGVSFKKGTNQVLLDENVVAFNVSDRKEDWIFDDFDRLFELVKQSTKSRERTYDIFGHSAGGQILHRFALFQPRSKADRIIASNAGTYTIPDFNTEFPFGMHNVGINKKRLRDSFRKNLVLFLGELDNDSETRGRMLRSKTADKQGTNRLDRGKYFYRISMEKAKESKLRFNWKLEIVPDVGHDQKKMAKAAAVYLYGT